MKRTTWLSVLMLALGTPLVASAADGYVTANVNLRAGPDIGYPRIDTLPAGVSVDIYGCTDGWAWCDVSYRGDRGWIAGNYIDYYDDDRWRPVPDYGAQIGIPIVTFIIGSYWGQHYSDRSFYRERSYWYRRPMPHRAPPPPPRRPWHPPGRPDHGSTGLPGHRPQPGHGGHPDAGQRPNPGRPGSNDGHRPPSSHGRDGQHPNPVQRPQPRPSVQPTPRPMPSHQDHATPRPQPTSRAAPAAHPSSSHPQHGKPAPAKGRSDGHKDEHGKH